MSDQPARKLNIEFMFKVNDDVPLGKVAVKQLTKNKFLVMAQTEIPNDAIVKAIVAWVAKHHPVRPE